MFHRASRHTEDAKWRPMVKMGAVRLVEPALSTAGAGLSPQPQFSGPGSALWQEVWSWLASADDAERSPAVEGDVAWMNKVVSELKALCLSTTSEVERMDAACKLARLARAPASGDTALSALLALFTGEEERGRRAGLVGVSRAGAAAVPGLLGIVAAPPQLEGTPGTAGNNSNVQSPAEGYELPTHIAVDAMYLLRQIFLLTLSPFDPQPYFVEQVLPRSVCDRNTRH